MRIERMEPGDDDRVAALGRDEGLLDGPARTDATARFLAQPGHHLLVASDDSGETVGFVTGVEMTHPDKGTELFLYELGVADRARRQGVGRALVEALHDVARRRGCYGMWVIADAENTAAIATYASAGGRHDGSPGQVLSWELAGG